MSYIDKLSPEWQEAYRHGLEEGEIKGVTEERARIVRWMRSLADGRKRAYALAAAIEFGEHEEKP